MPGWPRPTGHIAQPEPRWGHDPSPRQGLPGSGGQGRWRGITSPRVVLTDYAGSCGVTTAISRVANGSKCRPCEVKSVTACACDAQADRVVAASAGDALGRRLAQQGVVGVRAERHGLGSVHEVGRDERQGIRGAIRWGGDRRVSAA
jgi:hypothetical protein